MALALGIAPCAARGERPRPLLRGSGNGCAACRDPRCGRRGGGAKPQRTPRLPRRARSDRRQDRRRVDRGESLPRRRRRDDLARVDRDPGGRGSGFRVLEQREDSGPGLASMPSRRPGAASRRHRPALLAGLRVAARGVRVGTVSRGPDAPGVGRYAHLRGIRIYYEVAGDGPPLLLLHGRAGDCRQFARQRPDFAARHRLILPDSRAQGRSTDGPGPLTYHEMAEDFVALLDLLGIPRADVMGWSDGGNVGIDLAIHHPARLARLVTFGSNFSPDGLQPADVEWNRTATAESFGPEMRAGWTARNPQPDHYEAAMSKILEMWRSEPRFTPLELGSIRAPTLVCAGEHDVVRREHTLALTAAIPTARSWIVPGASHGAMLERPDLVNPRVLAFLAGDPLR